MSGFGQETAEASGEKSIYYDLELIALDISTYMGSPHMTSVVVFRVKETKDQQIHRQMTLILWYFKGKVLGGINSATIRSSSLKATFR